MTSIPLLERLPKFDFDFSTDQIAAPIQAQPAVLAALARKKTSLSVLSVEEPNILLVGTPSIAGAESLTNELKAWLGEAKVALLPAWETLPFERVSPSMVAMGARLRVLKELSQPTGALEVVVAPVRALIQKIPSRQVESLLLKAGETFNREELIEWLVKHGYRREIQVSARGEMAVRGGIVDVWCSAPVAAGYDKPLRMEFFGDTIESLRLFSLADQLATDAISEVELFPAREFIPNEAEQAKAEELAKNPSWRGGKDLNHWQKLASGKLFDGMESWMCWLLEKAALPTDLIADSVRTLWVQPSKMEANAKRLQAEEENLAEALMDTWGVKRLESIPRLNASFERVTAKTDFRLDDFLPSQATSQIKATHWGTTGPQVIPHMKELLAKGHQLLVAAWNEQSARRLQEALLREGLDLPIIEGIHKTGGAICVAPIDEGCIFPELKLAIITETQLTNKQNTRVPTNLQAGAEGGSASWNGELAAGSYVVHKTHGIGRYLGVEIKNIGGLEREYLVIQYRGNDKLYLPAEQIGTLSLHSVGEAPKLNSLGGGGWKKAHRKAKAEAEAIARELVELYGERNTVKGHSFLPDTSPHEDLSASFLFQETPDQLAAIQSTTRDMEKAEPMDRLIYGDVGFGKTEIAIRAAFKAIYENKQVALLVPTTLLARQHHQTFKERYGDFPIRVEMLSRFIQPKQAEQILEDMAAGKVDLVIGTHRLLSKDIRFADLGLLIIDEEQRFGVRHKEKLKSHYKNVDILTLTATPIPRTLEMSLTGIRDFSVIKTPPLERHPILTHVGTYDPRAVSEAIRRELLREGQVFFVHNRVASINGIAKELQELVPQARVAIAHGQMNETALEQVVLDFTDKQYDVLICTTIIESGIDMPRVNTLIVNRSETLGLGQLHQLRGRVGRAGAQAYAYLFTTPEVVLSAEAEERLRTIGETTALGSGFQLAMRDLEIRGAGNLLGFGQSGHMGSVGYDMYCDLVAEAVSRLKGQPPPPPKKEVNMDLPIDARLPEDYVPAESQRLDAYRRLFMVDADEIQNIEKEWRDRFGPLPPQAQALLSVARLKNRCAELGIENLSVLKSSSSASIVRLGPFVHQPKYTNPQYECVHNSTRQELNLSLQTRSNAGHSNMAEEILAFLEDIDL